MVICFRRVKPLSKGAIKLAHSQKGPQSPMSRIRISASNISDSATATALRQHASERSAILAHLTDSFKADPRIRAALLWGSFMRGEEDDLSDLDIWLFVCDEDMDQIGKALASYCASAGKVVTFGEAPHNAPPSGGYCSAMLAGTHGLHHLDIYWQPVSMCADPDAPKLASGFDWQTAEPITLPAQAILFNRIKDEIEPASSIHPPKPDPATENSKLPFIWLMLSITAKYLARDPSSDMSLLRYAKPSFEEAVAELGLEEEIGEVDWSSPTESVAKVNLLRLIVAKTDIIEEAYRSRGCAVSQDALPRLRSYFDLVEGILNHAKH
jgi:hypothetical protein